MLLHSWRSRKVRDYRRGFFTFLCSFSAAIVAPNAYAQNPQDEVFYYNRPEDRMAFDIQLFEPSGSARSITTVDLGTIASHLGFTVGLWTDYAHRPWVEDVLTNGMRTPDST